MITPPERAYLCSVTIGREAELGLIREHLARCAPGVIVIAGEAGIGKSRLARDAATLARDLGYQIVQGACFESDAGAPFAPLRDLLRSLATTTGPEEIARLAGDRASSLAHLLPDLAPAFPNAARHEKRDLFDALDRLLAALAEASPLMVLLEDLHWSDADTLAFLLVLAQRSTTRPLAVVLTCRDDEIGPDLAYFLAELDRARLALEVPLNGLAPREVEAMLRAVLGLTRRAPADLLHLLLTLTEGNPFFIEEMLKVLGATGIDSITTGRWTAPDADHLQVPRSIQDTVQRRLGRLSADARVVAELAAVVGTVFDADLVRDLAAIDEAALLAALKELIEAQLIVEESAERCAFRHALSRQAVYAGLLSRERRRLHHQVAEALERSQDPPEDAALAYHFFAATAWPQALTYSRRAGERSMALHAPQAAIAHYSRAIEAARMLGQSPDPVLYRARGSAQDMLGAFERALADYEEARVRAREAGARAAETETLLSLGLLWTARDYTRAGETMQVALANARELGDDALTSRCLNRLGNWHVNLEQPVEAHRCHMEALALAEGGNDRRTVAETLDLLGVAAFIGGDLALGATQCMRAVDVWREVGDHRGLASSLILLGMRSASAQTDTLPAVASHTEARIQVEEGLSLAREIGWRSGESWGLWKMGGLIFGAAGEYDDALEATRASLAIAEEIEHRQWTAVAHYMLGAVYAGLLAFSQSRSHLERAFDLAREINSPYWIRNTAGSLASVAAAQGDLDRAAAVLDLVLDTEASNASLSRRLVWSAMAELALQRGEADRALQIADHLVASAPNASTGRPIIRLEKLRGEALQALGDTDGAETALIAARDEAAMFGYRPMLWRIHLALGRLYASQDRTGEAGSAFDAARALVDTIATRISEDELRTGFLEGAASLFPAQRAGRRRADPNISPLTKRELEVARLLTQGLSNREIAATLFITEWTAATHIRNILAKLGLNSRTQIAAWAVAQGLGDTQETATPAST
jgi:DNA-binding CsgD family transcriptional regulator/predicted negative regulator of RcsB-dependent stress response